MKRKTRNDHEQPEGVCVGQGECSTGAIRVGEELEALPTPPYPHSLTFPHILLTLAHIHVDELWPLHTEGNNIRG